jgi:hypothetical protein
VRFYVPEWDDAVDAHYDFEHDELSTLERDERELNYIWDIFDRESTPIDGVLISREKVEEARSKASRLRDYGVYDDPVLSIPEWLPTISDCGAWGYKWLPFPPYGNHGMLEFYADMDVSVGVTIDHLVLGSGKERGRLYLDERAFSDDFDPADIPETVTDVVELKVESWPEEWPPYVREYEPSICTDPDADIEPFTASTFEGNLDAVLERLDDDPRAVYRSDDKQFRYDLTLRNAREMFDLYEDGDYSFRLMAAIQGWDPEKYVSAAEEVLEYGYRYVGIGGVAGSPVHDVRRIVKDVGKTIKEFERAHDTRVDAHVFGFAKTEAFEAIGRSGMTSFDSASMLRSAWTGDENYRLDSDEGYDAIRVRYPPHGADLDVAIEAGLRGRETLVALRAYGADESIPQALRDWRENAERALDALEEYLREHRHDDAYAASRLRDIESYFREDFAYADELNASFSGDFRRQLAKYLRADDPDDPDEFETYARMLEVARETLKNYPRSLDSERDLTDTEGLELISDIVSTYAEWVGDDDLIEAYEETLRERPWERCSCSICSEIGIEVAIFRGNDRNRRRGFHNTRRFYDQFQDELPKTLVLTQATASLMEGNSVEDYLRANHSEFWNAAHDLPVAEIGAFDANGIHEWWEETPQQVSFASETLSETLGETLQRYQRLFVFSADGTVDDAVREVADQRQCELIVVSSPTELREAVLHSFGENYVVGRDFLPQPPEISADSDLEILIIDQCSGSKDVPEDAPVFEAEDIDGVSKAELLNQPNVPGINASDLYTGRQQEYIDEAVRLLRGQGVSVDRYYVSAGFGVVAEEEPLPPYEVTFSGMKAATVRNRSARLSIPSDIERILTDSSYDIVFLAMGKRYYRSIDVDEAVRKITPDRIGVVFNRELVDRQYDNIVSVPARTEDAKRHNTIVIGLKGLYVKNFATNLSEIDVLDPERISELCRKIDTTQTVLPD